MQNDAPEVLTQVKVEAFDPASPPAHLPNVHEKAGFTVKARNRYANKGIPELIQKMTGALVTGSFDVYTMNFPSNMYYHQSNGELAIRETAPFAVYMDRVVEESDPVERIKFLTCAIVTSFLTYPVFHVHSDPPHHRYGAHLP